MMKGSHTMYVIQNSISLLMSWVIPSKELANETYILFSQFGAKLCPQFEQNLPVSSRLCPQFEQNIRKTYCFVEQDSGITITTQNAFPDNSIQSLSTLFGIRSELLEFRVKFTNSGWVFEFGVKFTNLEWVFRIRSEIFEFGVSF